MTGTAGTYHLRVIDIKCGCPYIWVVAILAHVGRRDMRGALADSFHTIMAADAVASDIHMIKVGGYPAGRRMTIIASVATADMRRILAGSDDAIVARTAGSDDLSMVDRRDWLPCVAGVAVLAYLGRLDMR